MKTKFIQLAVLLCIVLSAGFVAAPSNAQTSSPFRTTLVTTYDVTTAIPKVTHQFTVTNTQPTQYLSRYALKVSSPNISNVQVTANGTTVEPEVVSTNNATSIGITFPDAVVGEGKQRDITISYLHPDAAIASGRVLEVSVPRVDGANTYDEYTVNLITPIRYGEPTRITPSNHTFRTEGASLITTVPITNGAGVTALFGNEQLFQIQIEYDLRNPSQNTSLAQITLPPDTNRQRMYYQSLEPRPLKVESDADGNWIATYQLPAQTNITVVAEAVSQISLFSNPLPTQTAPDSELLQSQQFWESNDTLITEQANQLSNIRSIYDFVVETLSYDYSQITDDRPRLGAVEALLQPTLAACEEFTDLFVALARAKDIPARRITGYAYTRNETLRPQQSSGDVLHAWPEYYDQAAQDWIPVDPTWENTTGGINYFDLFDLNHITFAIQGRSSTLPYPAGASFNDGEERKLIDVAFAEQLPDVEPNWQISLKARRVMGVPIPGLYTLELSNQTGRAWYTVSVSSTSNDARITVPEIETQVAVLPFQTIEVPVRVTTSDFVPHTATLTTTITHDNYQTPIELTVTGAPLRLEIIASVAMGGVIVLTALLAWRVLVRRRRR